MNGIGKIMCSPFSWKIDVILELYRTGVPCMQLQYILIMSPCHTGCAQGKYGVCFYKVVNLITVLGGAQYNNIIEAYTGLLHYLLFIVNCG